MVCHPNITDLCLRFAARSPWLIAGIAVAQGTPPVTRKGHKVTTRMITHYAGNKNWGTFSAKFDDGQTLTGKSTATRKK